MMERINITIDTREQSPWAFHEAFASCVRGTISTGDYALTGDEANFAIERKSLDDFLGTISSGWDRFQRELERMTVQEFPARIIIVEARYRDCCFYEDNGDLVDPNHNHPRLTPSFINSRIAELLISGVSVVFADDPLYSSALALAILLKRKKQKDNNDGDNKES